MTESSRAVVANEAMVNALVGNGRLRNPRTEQAFRAVLRHWFLPGHDLAEVYDDVAIVTQRGADEQPVSSSSQPAIIATMLEQLDVRQGHHVLEIGTGTGYNAALLGHLVGPAGRVDTIDIDPAITGAAERNLRTARASNVTVTTGDGWDGVAARSPFDRIEATVGVWDLAPAWIEQLAPDGLLVAPLWLRAGLQASVAFTTTDDHLESVSVEPCGFMRLRGVGSGPESYVTIDEWTVSLDEPAPDKVSLLGGLLRQTPRTAPARVPGPGWFTAIALGDPDAVILMTYRDGEPSVLAGILDAEDESLAVIERTRPTTLHAYGGDRAQQRLDRLVRRSSSLDLTGLVIEAIPSDRGVAVGGATARLTRPNLTFVVRTA